MIGCVLLYNNTSISSQSRVLLIEQKVNKSKIKKIKKLKNENNRRKKEEGKRRGKRRSIPPLLACHDKFTTFTFSHKNTIKKLIKEKEERRGRRDEE